MANKVNFSQSLISHLFFPFSVPEMVQLSSYLPASIGGCKCINLDSPIFQQALVLVILAPLIWNIVARTIRTFLPKSTSLTVRYLICYALAVWIFAFSSYRDIFFHKSVETQPQTDFFGSPLIRDILAGILLGFGQLFVLTSFYKLGITGTFLGDYCGIFMNERVTGFPFNVVENPMYIGSTMSFLGYSLYYGSWAGLIITAEVFIVYQIALMFEGPYTTQIYLERDAARKTKGKKVQ